MRSKLALILAAIFMLAMALPVFAQDGPPPPENAVVTGLNGPQGLYIDDEGTLWIVDSGVGGDEEVEYINPNTFEVESATFGQSSRVMRVGEEGELEVVAELPSVVVGQDAIGGARITELDGTLYVTVGAWQASLGDEVTLPNQAQIIAISAEGDISTLTDVWAFELENNPDGTGNLESHPYGITAAEGILYMVDAAGNFIIAVEPSSGDILGYVAFEGVMGVFPNEFRDGEPIADPVPTGVVQDVEADVTYVSFLSGAPFLPGNARVVEIAFDGTVSDFATGLTTLTDLKAGPDGNLYAVQFGMFTEEGPLPNSGAVIRILEDGSAETVIEGLPFATAIAISEDGTGYVAINGVAIPGAGAVLEFPDLVNMEGTPIEAMEMPMGEEDMGEAATAEATEG